MQPRDLFNVILKIFGLFIIKDILASIPYIITPILSFVNEGSYKDGMISLLFPLIFISLYFFISFMLIFRTASVLNLLKLKQDFLEENLALNISTRNITIIGLIVLSGMILITEIPSFCNALFNYYQQSQIRFSPDRPTVAFIIISAVKILIAFLIIGERRSIVQLILKDQTPKEEE